MTTKTLNMNIPITFEVTGTTMWMGKRDRSGNPVNETVYEARAHIFGTYLGRGTASTEAAAIEKAKAHVKNNWK